MIRLSDQDRLYYTLKGEARLLSTGLLVQSVPLQDIYLRTRWTHDEFSISPMEVSILGQRFSVEAEGNGEGFTAKLDADAIELSEFLGSLGGRGASDWLSGSFDVRARWDGNQIHVEPIRLQNLKVAGMAARLEPFQVRLRNPARIELYSVGGEAAQGALLSPLIRLEEGVLSLSAGLKDMRPSLFPKIAPLMEKLGMKGELMAEMKASIPLNRPESSAMQLEGKLVRLEAFGFPAESLSFEANATTSSIVLSGVLKLPLEDGGVNFQARLDEEEGWLHLHSRRLDTGFLRYRFSSLPVGGVIDDASLRFQFYPVWEGSLEMKSTELRYASQSFRNFSLHSNLKPDRAWFKIVDDSLRFSVHGTHILSFPQDAALLLELPRHLKNAHAELSEKNLARLIPLGLGRFIHLDHGALQMSANWNEKDLELVVETLQLEARNTRLELGKPARIGMGGAGADGEILLKLSQEGGSLVLRAGQNRLGLELKDLKASSLQAFAPVSWPVHATARLNAKMLWEEPLQAKQSVLAEIKARNLNLNAWGKPMFVDAIDVKAGYRNGLIRVDHLHLIRNKAELHASLRMPSDAVFTAQKFADLPFRAEFKAPGFALQDIKPLLPDSVKELKGDFAADLVVENSLQGQLEATGYLRALMEPLEYDDPQTGRIYLDRLRLDATLSQQTLKLTTLSLRLENFYADLVGRLTLENDFPFELAGRAHSPLFEVSWLKLENASIEGLNLLGRLGSIQGSGRLKYDTGLVRHDALMLWLDEPHSPLSIPGFEDHHFHLQVRSNSRPTVLQGGLFRFELEPAFDVHLDRMGALMDGSARVVRGRMDIARNRFEAEPSSLIRFVPKRPVFKLGKPDEAAKNLLPQGIWEQNDFAMASLEQKLSMLWKQQPQNLRLKYQDDSSFETWLKLRATSRRNSSQLELSVNGPLNALNPVILQNGQPLAQEDAQKLGIGAVPGRHTGSSTQEEQLVSSQLTASVEDQLIGRRFEGLLRDVFGLNHVSLQSGLIQNPAVTAQSGAGFRLGTSLSKDVEVYHEQETLGSSTINRTQLEFRLSPGTDLWFEQKRETYDFKSVLGEEKDVQFGIQRKWRF